MEEAYIIKKIIPNENYLNCISSNKEDTESMAFTNVKRSNEFNNRFEEQMIIASCQERKELNESFLVNSSDEAQTLSHLLMVASQMKFLKVDLTRQCIYLNALSCELITPSPTQNYLPYNFEEYKSLFLKIWGNMMILVDELNELDNTYIKKEHSSENFENTSVIHINHYSEALNTFHTFSEHNSMNHNQANLKKYICYLQNDNLTKPGAGFSLQGMKLTSLVFDPALIVGYLQKQFINPLLLPQCISVNNFSNLISFHATSNVINSDLILRMPNECPSFFQSPVILNQTKDIFVTINSSKKIKCQISQTKNLTDILNDTVKDDTSDEGQKISRKEEKTMVVTLNDIVRKSPNEEMRPMVQDENAVILNNTIKNILNDKEQKISGEKTDLDILNDTNEKLRRNEGKNNVIVNNVMENNSKKEKQQIDKNQKIIYFLNSSTKSTSNEEKWQINQDNTVDFLHDTVKNSTNEEQQKIQDKIVNFNITKNSSSEEKLKSSQDKAVHILNEINQISFGLSKDQIVPSEDAFILEEKDIDEEENSMESTDRKCRNFTETVACNAADAIVPNIVVDDLALPECTSSILLGSGYKLFYPQIMHNGRIIKHALVISVTSAPKPPCFAEKEITNSRKRAATFPTEDSDAKNIHPKIKRKTQEETFSLHESLKKKLKCDDENMPNDDQQVPDVTKLEGTLRNGNISRYQTNQAISSCSNTIPSCQLVKRYRRPLRLGLSKKQIVRPLHKRN